MDPINYSMDVKSPFEQSMSGFAGGIGMQENIVKMQQMQQQQALSKQLQVDLAGLSQKPDAKASDFAGMMIKYPQLSEHFKRGWDTLNGEQQQNKLSQATQVYAAVNSGRPDIASDLLTQQAAALRNSGKEDEAKAAETMAQFIQMDPKSAKTTTGLLLSSLMGPEKFADTFTKLEKENRDAAEAPADLLLKQGKARKEQADADMAEITARYGERSKVAELAKTGWDIKKIEADIGINAQNARINAMNAQSTRMNAITNQGELGIKKADLGLKLDEAKRKREEDISTRIADVTSARGNIDNMLNTVDKLLAHPGLPGATGSIAGRLPSFRQDSANFDALIENANAQAFLSQIPQMKGMGSLSDAEGKKLAAALQTFSTTQDAGQLTDALKEAQRLLLKGRSNLVAKYRIPDTVPDTPAAAPTQSELDGLLKKYGAPK